MSTFDLASRPTASARVHLRLTTVELRDHTPDPDAAPPSGVPTIVVAPFIGQVSGLADHGEGPGPMEVLATAGVAPLYLTSWRAATPEMAGLGIESYIEDLLVCLDDLGGSANLVGLGLGGWICALLAARFPERVNSLALVGTPIDGEAVEGPTRRLVRETSLSTHRSIVKAGHGIVLGRFLVDAWPGLDPLEHGLAPEPTLWEELDAADRRRQGPEVDRWYEDTPDLPGRLYLEAVERLFLRNEFAHGSLGVLGRALDPAAIRCPLYLVAGETDAFVPAGQVFAAARLFGTPPAAVRRQLVPAGHHGLFLGATSLHEVWPQVGAWLVENSRRAAERLRRSPA